MKFLSEFFVRAKHWQIFLLDFGLWLLGSVGVLWFAAISTGTTPKGVSGEARLVGVGLVEALSLLGFLSQYWFIGTFLRSMVRPALRPRATFFRVAIIYPAVFSFAIPSIAIRLVGNPGLTQLFLLASFFAMICGIYDVNFVAKNLAVAMTGKPQTLPEFKGEFLMLMVHFPVGVWSIQPKVNRLYQSRWGG